MRQLEFCDGFVLGATLQVITWPMGFIILAKGKSAHLLLQRTGMDRRGSLALAWVCVRSFGLNGAGIAFFGSYVFHGFLIYPIVRQLSGFRWSRASKQTGLLFLSLIAVVFTSFYVLPLFVAASIGALATILSGVYSLRSLIRLTALDPAMQRRFYQVKDRFNSAVRAFGWSQ